MTFLALKSAITSVLTSAFFVGRVWLVAAASVASKFGLGPYSLVVDGKLIRKKVKFYFSQVFPEVDSEEFMKLPEDLKQKLKKFNPKPDEDLLEWLKLFDPEDIYNIRIVKKMVITKKPFAFVHGLLQMILDEMQETALALLKWFAEENVEGEEEDAEGDTKPDVEGGAECGAEGGAKSDVEGGAECDAEGGAEYTVRYDVQKECTVRYDVQKECTVLKVKNHK